MTHAITRKIIISTFVFLLVSVAIFAGKRQIVRSFSEFWGEQYSAQGEQYVAGTKSPSMPVG